MSDTQTVPDDDATADDATPVLEATDLGHAFGDVDVFSGVDVSLSAGTVTAVVGPNGSGKTTLLRAILGLFIPDSGAVTLTADPDVDRRIGYLPQNPAFRGRFTVAETLRFYASLLDADVDVPAVLDRVGLSDVRDRRVAALSGGMVRLLGIGQAILGRPPVVVFDEPTGDLDPRMTEYVFDVIADLADDGMTVLLATHDLSGAAAADSVLLLDRGSIAARGSPVDLRERTDSDHLRSAFLSLTGRDPSDDDVAGPRPVSVDETGSEGR